jgi:hypothetical protein
MASQTSSTVRKRPLAATASTATVLMAHRTTATGLLPLLERSGGGRSVSTARLHSRPPTTTGPPISSEAHRPTRPSATASRESRSRMSTARITNSGKPPCQNTQIHAALAGRAPNSPVGENTPGNVSNCSATASAVKA